MHNSLVTASAGLMILLGLGAARSEPEWTVASPPPGTVALPVASSRALSADADVLNVCTDAGLRPRAYPVLSRTCWDGAAECTVFVAFPVSDDIRIQEYDARNPPVAVATDDVCTAPVRPVAGILPRTPPQG